MTPLDLQGDTASNTRLGKFEQSTRRGVRALMKLTGMDATTSALMKSGVLSYVNEIGRLVEDGATWSQVESANPLLHSRMIEMGMDGRDWQKFTKDALTSFGEGKDRVSFLEPEKLSDGGRTLLAFLDRETRFMVSSPDLMTKAYNAKFQGGTVAGEAWRAFMMYKMFGIGMLRQSVFGSIREGGAKGFVKLAAPLTMMAAMKIQAEQMLTSDEFYDWESPVLWTRALDQSSVMWIVGSLLANETRAAAVGQETTAWSALRGQTGPIYDEILRGADVSKAWAKDLYNDGVLSDKVIAKTLDLGIAQIPLQNVWMWRGAITGNIKEHFADSFDPAGAAAKRRDKQVERGPWR